MGSLSDKSLTPSMYSGAIKPVKQSYKRSESPKKENIPSPLKRKRSKSPLRQDRPSEVF